MRSTEQINLIKQTQSDPWQIENFLSTAEVENLKDYFFSKQSLLDQKSRKLGHLGLIGPEANHKGGADAIQFVLDRLQEQVGKFEVRNATFFLATQPHRIHNDASQYQTFGQLVFGYKDYQCFTGSSLNFNDWLRQN